MPKANQVVLEFLKTRRSRPAKTLTGPGPDRAQVEALLEMAARVPDHGMLVPWRFQAIAVVAMPRLAAAAKARAAALGLPVEKQDKIAAVFANAPRIVAVIARPEDSEKVPEVEQILSTGAVCLSLLNAALASGWGANWLTGVMATDPVFRRDALGLAAGEFVAGFIIIGTETSAPAERPRPDMDEITEWIEA